MTSCDPPAAQSRRAGERARREMEGDRQRLPHVEVGDRPGAYVERGRAAPDSARSVQVGRSSRSTKASVASATCSIRSTKAQVPRPKRATVRTNARLGAEPIPSTCRRASPKLFATGRHLILSSSTAPSVTRTMRVGVEEGWSR